VSAPTARPVAPPSPTFGAALRAARLARRLRLVDVARRAGVSVMFVCDLEHDRRNPSGPGARRVAEAADLAGHWRDEERTLRGKAAAWDFLTSQEPVPGATLADYLDAAGAYAYDETGVDLAARRAGGG
jgi:transcriptional regulator with XRE-family HTH domain